MEAGGLALTYLGEAARFSTLLTPNDAPPDRAHRRGKTKVGDQGYRHTKPARERVAAAAAAQHTPAQAQAPALQHRTSRNVPRCTDCRDARESGNDAWRLAGSRAGSPEHPRLRASQASPVAPAGVSSPREPRRDHQPTRELLTSPQRSTPAPRQTPRRRRDASCPAPTLDVNPRCCEGTSPTPVQTTDDAIGCRVRHSEPDPTEPPLPETSMPGGDELRKIGCRSGGDFLGNNFVFSQSQKWFKFLNNDFLISLKPSY